MLELAAFGLAFTAYLYLVGWVTDLVRLAAARLPTDVVSSFAGGQILGDGLRSTALTTVAFAVLCALAYLTSTPRWEVNGQDWHDIVRKKGVGAAGSAAGAGEDRRAREQAAKMRIRARNARVRERFSPSGRLSKPSRAAENTPDRDHPSPREPVPKPARPESAPIGETGVRIVAGFNILILAAVIASAVAVGVDELLIEAWWAIVPCWAIMFLASHYLLMRWGPLRWGAALDGGSWALIAAVALFASAPLGVLVLTGIAISTLGRALCRLARPRSVRAWVRSPLPWVLAAIVALIGLAYRAIPPVSFTGALITSPAGDGQGGGYLTRADGGVYLATCRQRLDATSTDERVRFIPSSAVKTIALGGHPEVFDSGERPSLATLALKALGLEGSAPTLVAADLRPRRGTCSGGTPSSSPAGGETALGPSAIYGPAPAGGQAHDGEPPIERTSPAWVAALARRYQPTLEVTAADRFWPVSVGALLADRGPGGEQTCLVQRRAPGRLCNVSPSSLGGTGSLSSDYLQFPAHLGSDTSPELQFEAFERGQSIEPGPAESWLTDPRVLNPWYTAQIYFYYAGPLERSSWPVRDARLPRRVDTLEYWFYYQYNYFPLVVSSTLMQEDPIAADRVNVDFHQGDWEHVDVLLDAETHAPLWLYMARHSDEGQFVRWDGVPLILDQTHPVVQAAFGGHPSYAPSCGQQRRPKTRGVLSDWLVCGSRFVFSASGTPLVDIAQTPWACWRGHFGEAVPGVESSDANKPETILDELSHQVFVAGPISPLRQAENTGVCDRDPRAPEMAAP